MAAGQWTIVGYHAFTWSDWMQVSHQAQGSENMVYNINPLLLLPTPLEAVASTRKILAKKLGVSLSESIPPGSATKLKRASGRDADETIHEPKYMILSLYTKENLAEAVSEQTFRPRMGGGYTYHGGFDPTGCLRLSGKWRIAWMPPSF